MKKSILFLATLLVLLATGACSKEHNEPWVVNYPEVNYEGNSRLYWEAGTPFVAPGLTAVIDGEDVTNTLVMTTSMNVENPQPGYYTVNYTYPMTGTSVALLTIEVFVTDASDKISGWYTTDPESVHENESGPESFAAGKDFTLTILKKADGTYAISDLLGGYYDQGRGYGSGYALRGVFDIDGSDVTLDSYTVISGWSTNPVEDFADGSYDADTNSLHWVVEYAGTPFDIYITKYIPE